MRYTALLLGLAALVACSSRVPSGEPAPPPPRESALPAAEAAGDTEAAVAGTNALGIDLYKQVSRPGENVFLSPPSIATALSMAYAGARGETAAEMGKVLRSGLTAAAHGKAYGQLSRAAALNSDGARVTVANAVWLQQGFAVERTYVDALRRDFGAPPEIVDFGQAQAAADRINDWTRRNTGGRITELFSPASFTVDTRLVLANAVYLKADWLSPFKAYDTRPAPFFLAPRGLVSVKFLNGQKELRYLDGDGFTAVALPYRGDTLSMLVFLPKPDSDLSRFERALGGAALRKAMRALDSAPIVPLMLALPKLKLETTYPLVPELRALGMVRALRKGADFSGIGRSQPLHIDEVVHKTFLQVDEKGTEAAAVTGVEIIATGARIPPPLTFRADRPFFFVIRDNRSGSALFMGRIVDPK